MKDTIIVLTRRWTSALEDEMQRQFNVRLNHEDAILSREQIVARCESATILSPTVSDVIDDKLIASLPDSIRLIACYGVGVERIDVEAAKRRNILVSNTPGAVVDDTADLAFGLIIATCRRFAEGDAYLRRGRWKKFALDFMLGTSIHGKTLGIIGMGDIGTAVVRRARGFNMPVLYHNRHRNEVAEKELGVQFCENLEDLLEQADIVSVHCPLTETTRHLINQDALRHMKSSAVLINTARGPVVDELALIDALQNGIIAGAGLDVYENEPDVSEELIQIENTVLVPHLGTATVEARNSMGYRVIKNITSFLESGYVPDEVTTN